MAKVCEICGHKEEGSDIQNEEKSYELLGICESCLEDRSSSLSE